MLIKGKKSRLKLVILSSFIFLITLVFESMLLMLRFNRLHRYEPEIIGVSFSQVQAERYGSDWKHNYLAILDDLKFKHVRLAAYWDRIERNPNQYDFSELDWMINEAKKRNTKITLVVGQKVIRAPECYYPNWLNKNNPQEVQERIKPYLTEIIKRYQNEPIIETWQLENEFLLKSFGDCPHQNLTTQNLKNELNLLRKLDNSRPIVLTQSDQFGFPIKGPFGEVFGFSMYRWSWHKAFGYFYYPQPGAYFWWKAAIIETLLDQKVKIHELQAEAWGPVGNEYISYEEANKSMNPKQLIANIQYARDTKIRQFDLWGAEWWWYLKQNSQPQMWEIVKKIINS